MSPPDELTRLPIRTETRCPAYLVPLAGLMIGGLVYAVLAARAAAGTHLGWGLSLALVSAIVFVALWTHHREVRVTRHEIRLVTRWLGRTTTRRRTRDEQSTLRIEVSHAYDHDGCIDELLEVYPVRFGCPGDELEFYRFRFARDARAWGARLAATLGVPLLDRSRGREEIHGAPDQNRAVVHHTEWASLEWPNSDRIGRVAASVHETGRVTFRIAPPGLNGTTIFVGGFLALSIWIFLYVCNDASYAQANWGRAYQFVILCLVLGVALACAIGIVRQFTSRETVEVDVHGASRGAEAMRTREIEQVFVTSSNDAILLRGEDQELRIGSQLDPNELEGLRHMILLALGGKIDPTPT